MPFQILSNYLPYDTVISGVVTSGVADHSDGTNLSGNLYSTGNILNNRILSLSGDLYNTGNVLNNRIISLSGDLYTTGHNLYAMISGVSGKWYKETQLYSGYNPILIDWNSGNFFKYILTGNVSISHTNTSDGRSIIVGIGNTGNLNYTVNWDTSIHWPSNTAPLLSSGNKLDIFTAIKLHTGIYMNAVQNFYN